MRLLLLALLLAAPAAADTLRVATWDAGLSRDGPGLLLADLAEPDAAILAATRVIQAVRPDILLLTGIDDDRRGLALAAFRTLLATGTQAIDYPHVFHAQVNAGDPSFRDLDGDGRTTGRDDAWGWGRFPGHGGMALLSRLPLGQPRTFRLHPWGEGRRLSSRSHWDVPATLPDGRRLHLLASNPTPPLFADENPRRNADEISFWSSYLSGTPTTDDAGLAAPLPDEPAIVLGNLNADPSTAPACTRPSRPSSPIPACRIPAPPAPAARRRRPLARKARPPSTPPTGPSPPPATSAPTTSCPAATSPSPPAASPGPPPATPSPKPRPPPPRTASSGWISRFLEPRLAD